MNEKEKEMTTLLEGDSELEKNVLRSKIRKNLAVEESEKVNKITGKIIAVANIVTAVVTVISKRESIKSLFRRK